MPHRFAPTSPGWLLFALFAAWTVGAGHAAAQAAEPAGYRAAIEEAVAEYDAGHFAEARSLFQRAHDLAPSARTLRGLGMAEFELRSYPASAGFLEQALASQVKPLERELRTRTEELLERARGFLGRFTLELEPPDAQLMIDGATVQLPADGALWLGVGDHTLDVRAPGRVSVQKSVRVTGGEERTVGITLPTQEAVTPTAAAKAGTPEKATAKDDDGGSILSSPWLWTAIGAVVVGGAVGVGIVLGVGGETTDEAPYGGDSGAVLTGP